MSFLRAALPRFWALALGEARLAAAGAQSYLLRAAFFTAWAATAIFLGSVLGIAAVVLPPTGIFGIVLVAALILLWVLPELPVVAESTVRRLFFAFVLVTLCVPGYYAFTIPGTGLPWISVRRLFIFALVIAFGYNYAVSSAVRSKIAGVLRTDYFMSVCVICFYVWIILSILTSASPTGTMDGAMTVFLELYLPLFAALYVIDNEEVLLKLVLMICWCGMFVAAAGVIEFFIHKNLFVAIMPEALKEALAANNPNFATFLNTPPIRDGLWRSSSVLISGIGFAQFEAMMTPIAYVFMVHGRSLRMKAFGAVLTILSIAGILVSGSRGGLIGLLAATPFFTAVWLVRTMKFNSRSMAPIVVGATAACLFATLIVLIVVWRKAQTFVFGGGEYAASDDARKVEWMMGIPHIVSNPITGHGYGLGATVIGYQSPGSLFPSVDSAILSFLVEVGIPGTIFFFGIMIVSCWRGAQRYISDPSFAGAISGGLSTTMVSFLVISTVLSQRDNYGFLFILAACSMLLHYFYSERRRANASLRARGSTGPRARRVAGSPSEQLKQKVDA